MSEVFTRRLRELNDEAKKSLAKALKTLSDPVLVRSAFELPCGAASGDTTCAQRNLLG
jgi:hypothetical protein